MNTVVLALASLATAVSVLGVSANADEHHELSRSSDRLAHSLMASSSAAPAGWLPVSDNSKLQPLEQRTLRSSGGSALVAGLSTGALVIPTASLAGSGQQQMLQSPNGQAAASGFSPIKAALAGQVETGNQLSRSAPAGRPSLLTPPN